MQDVPKIIQVSIFFIKFGKFYGRFLVPKILFIKSYGKINGWGMVKCLHLHLHGYTPPSIMTSVARVVAS